MIVLFGEVQKRTDDSRVVGNEPMIEIGKVKDVQSVLGFAT